MFLSVAVNWRERERESCDERVDLFDSSACAFKSFFPISFSHFVFNGMVVCCVRILCWSFWIGFDWFGLVCFDVVLFGFVLILVWFWL